MALRIPPRRTPVMVTLVEALNHICTEMMPAPESHADPKDLAAVITSDGRASEHAELAAEIANALLEAVADGRLSVGNVPDFELNIWRSQVGILDWPSGSFTLARPGIPYTLQQRYTPTVELKAAVAIFEEQPDASAARKASGPQPKARAAIKQRILAALRSGRAIVDGNHESVTADFGEGASRTTCVAALRDALSEFAAKNSDKP